MLTMMEAKSDLTGNSMRTFVLRFLEDESGVTAIEYALVGGLISVACIGAVTAVGNTLRTVYTGIAAALATAL
jgi:pilus assembly protein Flp/PilA